ncbi:MAG: replication protein [Candidatus Aerophobetes bacterium]|nr:replication protein [Candidatus Aerophobetes bacterium]
MKDRTNESKNQTNSYIQIPTDYFEALARTKISKIGNQILKVIERKTYGWHKEEDGISQRQFREATGVKSVGNILYGISQLEWQHIIIAKRKKGRRTVYKIQKDFTRWRDWNHSEYCKSNLSISNGQVTREKHMSISHGARLEKPKKGKDLSINYGAVAYPQVMDKYLSISHGAHTSKETIKDTISKERESEDLHKKIISVMEKEKDLKEHRETFEDGFKKLEHKTKKSLECGEEAFKEIFGNRLSHERTKRS